VPHARFFAIVHERSTFFLPSSPDLSLLAASVWLYACVKNPIGTHTRDYRAGSFTFFFFFVFCFFFFVRFRFL
jgi:hypothetical protein